MNVNESFNQMEQTFGKTMEFTQILTILMIIIGVGILIFVFIIILNPKLRNKIMIKKVKDVSKIAKEFEKEVKSNFPDIDNSEDKQHMQKDKIMCEYCGRTNDSTKNICDGCGSPLKRKKSKNL